MNKFMEFLIKEALLGAEDGGIPFGAMIGAK